MFFFHLRCLSPMGSCGVLLPSFCAHIYGKRIDGWEMEISLYEKSVSASWSVEGLGRGGWRRQEEAASGSRKLCQNGLCQHHPMVKDCQHGVRWKVSMGLASRKSYSNEMGKQIHIIMIQGFNGWWGHYSWCKLSKWSEGKNSSIKRAIEMKGVVNIEDIRRKMEALT